MNNNPVFNLTNKPLSFHRKVIPPNGGSVVIPELEAFVPTRDRKLETKGVLAFGKMPANWKAVPVVKAKPAVKKPVPAKPQLVVMAEVKSQENNDKSKKK